MNEKELQDFKKEILKTIGVQADKEIDRVKQALIKQLDKKIESLYDEDDKKLTNGIAAIISQREGIEGDAESRAELEKAAIGVKASMYEKLIAMKEELRNALQIKKRAGMVLHK